MTLEEKNDYLKSLDETDFRELGAPHVAYVREVEFLGGSHYAVHSADGAPIVIVANRDMALHAIQSQDMEPVTLH